MWSAIVVFVMAALTGFYMMPAERTRMAVQKQEAREVAESMAIYRQAVVAYFKANDVTDTSVDIATLNASGAVPAWSKLSTSPATVTWANYRDATGVIYIYPANAAPANIVSEVLKLSRNALTVGIYRAADQSLYSPADGSRVTLPSAGGAGIPDAALVWLAARD